MPKTKPKDSETLARLELAEYVRTVRKERSYTQEQLANELTAAGLDVSRSHYVNMEKATYPFRAEHLAVIDHVLGLSGSLIARAERSGVTMSEVAAPLVELGRELANELGEELPPLPDLEVATVERDAAPIEIAEGRKEVIAALVGLLHRAAAAGPPFEGATVEILGFDLPGLRRQGGPGLPSAVREAIRIALAAGWHAVHHIPAPSTEGSTTLAKVACPLARCPQFEARVVDEARMVGGGHLLVAPGVGAVEVFATGADGRLDSALVYGNDDAVELVQRRVQAVRAIGRTFAERFERHDGSLDGPDVTPEERAFKRSLFTVIGIPGPRRLMLGHAANSTIPPDLYARRLERRRRASTMPDDAVWEEMRSWQAARYEAAHESGQRGIVSREVLSRTRFADYVLRGRSSSSEVAWRSVEPDERRAHLDAIISMHEKYTSFELGLAEGRVDRALESARWEVRDGPGMGAVLIQTSYHGPTQPVRIDLMMSDLAAVRAFRAYFDEIWSGLDVVTDQDQVHDYLLDLRAQLG